MDLVIVLVFISAQLIVTGTGCGLPNSYKGSHGMKFRCLQRLTSKWQLFYGTCKPQCRSGDQLFVKRAIYLQYKHKWDCKNNFRIQIVTQSIRDCVLTTSGDCRSWPWINHNKNYKGSKYLFVNYMCTDGTEEPTSESDEFMMESGSGFNNATDFNSTYEMSGYDEPPDFNSTYEWVDEPITRSLIHEQITLSDTMTEQNAAEVTHSGRTTPTETSETTTPQKVLTTSSGSTALTSTTIIIPTPPPTNGNADAIVGDSGEEDDTKKEQPSLGSGGTAGLVIGVLVAIGGLTVLVVFVILRQRRLSKRLNDLENPVYKDPEFNSDPQVKEAYDNEAYGRVIEQTPNNKGPLNTIYDNHVINPQTIYDNNVQAKPAHVPYLEIVAHSNTYDEVTIQPEAPTYSVPDKDKVVPNAPPEDDPPEVPADYELAQPPVPPKSFITEDTLDYKVTGEDELVDNEAYRAFDGEGGDGLVYNDAYHALG